MRLNDQKTGVPNLNEERVLVERAQNGEVAAFRELVERHKKKVYYLALDLTGNHYDAEDLSQEVFIKAFQSIQTFRSEGKMSSWLYRITVNTNINQYRRKSFKARKLQESYDELSDSQNRSFGVSQIKDPEESAEAGMIQKHIDQALGRLTPRERSIFVLRHYNDLSLKEIALIHKVKEGTIKSMLFRSIKKLQKELSFYREELVLENSNG